MSITEQSGRLEDQPPSEGSRPRKTKLSVCAVQSTIAAKDRGPRHTGGDLIG